MLALFADSDVCGLTAAARVEVGSEGVTALPAAPTAVASVSDAASLLVPMRGLPLRYRPETHT